MVHVHSKNFQKARHREGRTMLLNRRRYSVIHISKPSILKQQCEKLVAKRVLFKAQEATT